MKRHPITFALAIVFLIAGILSFLLRLPFFSPQSKEQISFTSYLDELFSNWVSADSITLHYSLSSPAKYHIKEQAPSLSGNYFLNDLDYERELKALHRYSKDSLTKEQKRTYHILEDYLKRELSVERFPLYQTTFSPTTGLQAQLPITLCEFPLSTQEDILTYLSLLRQIPEYFSYLYAKEQEKSAQGLFCSNEILQQIIEQMDSFLSSKEENPLIVSFEERIAFLPLTNKDRSAYIRENRACILHTVLPAYKKLRKNLLSLKDTGTNPAGLFYHDRGKEYYTALIAKLTGSDRSPKELISITEKAISEYYRELEEILYVSPDAYERFLTYDLASLLPKDEKQTMAWLKEQTKKSFPAAPSVSYAIKQVPDCLQPYVSPAFYMIPPIDSYYNNTIYLNPHQLSSLSDSYGVLAHEGYPGHLYQTTYFYETMSHPILSLCNYEGYTEGWAVFAEHMSYSFLDYGASSDTICRLYQLNHLLNLAIPARIDLGVHYEGWKKENVNQYLSSLGLEKDEITSDIFYSVVGEPGNYLSYYIGYLEIDSLLEQYTKKNGTNADLKNFFVYFLQNGPCDFSYLLNSM